MNVCLAPDAQVGQKVSGKVLEVDVAARRMTLTLKPGLLGSKLQCLASLQQVASGLRAHGMISGVQVSEGRGV
jgi:rRNA biogenesis protein RRP5